MRIVYGAVPVLGHLVLFNNKCNKNDQNNNDDDGPSVVCSNYVPTCSDFILGSMDDMLSEVLPSHRDGFISPSFQGKYQLL